MGGWGCACGITYLSPPCFRGLSGERRVCSYLLCSGLGMQPRHQWQLEAFVSVMSLSLEECRLLTCVLSILTVSSFLVVLCLKRT